MIKIFLLTLSLFVVNSNALAIDLNSGVIKLKNPSSDDIKKGEIVKSKVQSLSTSNSLIKLDVDFPASIKWVMFDFSNNQFKDFSTYKVVNGKIQDNIAIKHSYGNYPFKMFVSTSESMTEEKYEYFCEGSIKNLDRRKLNDILLSQLSKTERERFDVEENIKELVTNDSSIMLNSSFNTEIKWVIIEFNKESKQLNQTYKVINGKLANKIYLTLGAGKYNLKIFGNKDESSYAKSYSFLGEGNITNTDKRDLSFLLPTAAVQSDDAEIKAQAQNIIGDATDIKEKILRIHDFVADYIEYDVDGYKSKTFSTSQTDALFTYHRKMTVCDGYSKLFVALLRSVGIKSAVVYGKALVGLNTWEDHAWSAVYYNNKWEYIDVTWDDKEKISHEYFFVDKEMFKKDHIDGVIQEAY